MQNPLTPDASLFTPLDSELTQGVNLIEQATNWQEKYRQIMLLGKKLPNLAEELRLESAQVKGCESQAWLYHLQVNEQHFYLADSDARIVKGLIAVLLVATQGKTSQQIAAFDVNQYFDTLGLSGQLSPSRTNGLHALANVIKDSAA
ncbi:SufE family protein [Shewanella aestuarii]|uniref:SufE family protein n=1 Tax=Shewanella aestuarii TaxID=1028752 RepID=A0A6G9QIH3_9GAMM|nr:SufE family protein [Shewanella aestuarii]QIR13681.1 SufE family protein [Shewanella aestuarii]